MLAESLVLPSDSTCILKAEPGKLWPYTKRCELGMLFISLPIYNSLFKKSNCDVIIDFVSIQRH